MTRPEQQLILDYIHSIDELNRRDVFTNPLVWISGIQKKHLMGCWIKYPNMCRIDNNTLPVVGK
jgi:hypothetical protein